MKLIVCFGQVKVIVPCGDGDLTVKDLIEKATSRYIKASLQENLEVDVKYLQTEEDAILDFDDVITDVCDDKDKLIAIFQEKTSSLPQPFNYQASPSPVAMAPNHITSSTGNGFPAVAGYSTNGYSINQLDRTQPVAPPPGFDDEKPPKYYRGNDGPTRYSENKNEKRSGREWRREAPRKSNEKSQPTKLQSLSSASSTPVSSPDTTKDSIGFNRFDRNLNRKSLSTAHPLLYSWIDAQERRNEDALFTNNMQYDKEKRLSESRGSFSGPSIGDNDDADDLSSTSSEEIELENRLKEDFGLRVQGYKNADGKELGLIVHEIKNDSVVGKRGSLNVADRITEVNGINLRDMSNSDAEAVLNKALACGPLKLKRTRSHHFIRASLRNVSMERHISLPKVPEAAILSSKEAPRAKQPVGDIEVHEAPIEDPEQKTPSHKPNQGNRLLIELSKGSSGLGFSITSRDVVTGGRNPVYVKNIMSNGAAITDGRLKVGDQIIEINGVDVSFKDQTEIVRLLKSASGIVKLLVNRQSKEVIDLDDNEEAMETASNDSGISTLKEEFLTMTIPLNDMGSAGLGISVKGKSTEDNLDLGIFVKSIIKGGAAAKDGRLKPEDRLIQINNISLDGLSNDKAMDALRSALKESVKQETKIKIVVSRKSKSEHSHLVTDGKPAEMQPSIRPSLLDFDSKESASIDKDYQRSRSPSREKPYPEKPRLLKKTSETRIDGTTKQPTASDTVKFVSISSGEIPRTQPCRPVMIDRSSNVDSKRRQLVEVKSTVFPKQKEFFYQDSHLTEPESLLTDENFNMPSKIQVPPSYKETLKRLSVSSSETSSSKSSQKNFPSRELPIGPGSDLSSTEGKSRYLIDDTIDDADLIRTVSTSSRFSIDSLMLSPDSMPFSRDAFGRLSMSERKGRAHLDATKSTLYTKLKKSKSLENVHSVKSINDTIPLGLLGNRPLNGENDTDIVPFREAARRTESLDTLLSNTHIVSDEEEAFHRNTALSKSTPWYAQRTVSPTALKLRSRSNAWNDSFRSAVDRSTVFYTQNGGSALKSQDDAIPIQLTSNANYTSGQHTKKKAGLLKGIGNLLKKNKPRRIESKNDKKDKEMALIGRGSTENERLIDFPRRPRPHSMHEEIVSNATRDVGDSIREKERAKREKEDRLVLLQRELNNIQQSENVIQNNMMKKQIERKSSKESLEKPSRQQIEDVENRQSGPYKSLLQRGQERILQREKNQRNANQQIPNKSAVRQGNIVVKSKRSLGNEFNNTGMDTVIKDEIPVHHVINNQGDELKPQHVKIHRSKPVQGEERVSDTKSKNSQAGLTIARPNPVLDSNAEPTVGSQSKRTLDYTEESNRGWSPLSTESRNNAPEEELGPKQRRLPETPLFYFGHSSLPRKFTMNNVRKPSLGDAKQPGYAIDDKNGVGKRGKPPARGGDRKLSGNVNIEQGNVNRTAQQTAYLGDNKQSGYSIEEQTEAFIRAQQGHQLRTSKRTSAQSRNQSNGGPPDGTITISHAANI